MLKNNIFYSSITTISRLLSGFVLVFVLARLLTVDDFGIFTYSLVFANVLVLIVEYGYNLKLSKDTAANKNRISELTIAAFKTKLYLFILLAIILCIIGFINYPDQETSQVLIILSLSSVSNSFANHFLIPYRSTNRFDQESKYVLVNNFFVLSFVSLTVFITSSILYAAIAFLIIKTLYFYFTVTSFYKDFGFNKPSFNLIKELKEGFPYAIHVAVGAMYLSVDTIILKEYVSDYYIGIYQAGMRALGAATIGIGIFNSVLIPRFSSLANENSKIVHLATKINRLVLIFGLLIAITVNVFSKQLIYLVFGDKYMELSNYVFWFSIIIFLRYFGLVYGSLLTISNNQKVRSIAVILTLILIVILDFIFIPALNLYGALYTLIISHIVLNIIYVFFTYRQFKTLMI